MLNSKFFYFPKPRQWRVSITSVLNRKNGFARPDGQNWRKSCGGVKPRKATFVTKFLSVLKTMLWQLYFLYRIRFHKYFFLYEKYCTTI